MKQVKGRPGNLIQWFGGNYKRLIQGQTSSLQTAKYEWKPVCPLLFIVAGPWFISWGKEGSFERITCEAMMRYSVPHMIIELVLYGSKCLSKTSLCRHCRTKQATLIEFWLLTGQLEFHCFGPLEVGPEPELAHVCCLGYGQWLQQFFRLGAFWQACVFPLIVENSSKYC